MENYDSNQNQSENKTKSPLSKDAKQGLIVFGIIFTLILSVGIYQFYQVHLATADSSVANENSDTQDNDSSKSNEDSSFDENDYIAVVHIEGVIQDENQTYKQSWLLDTIEDLAEDEENRAILVYIDSPGGGVYQSDEVYLALEKYIEDTDKPLWAYMGPIAASGGYYIACAADTIYANRNTLTGSIGVITGQSVDLTELMSKYGIKMTTITAGKNKNMMNIDSPLTVEQRAILQSIADEAYDQFTEIVAQSREMNIERVREISDGRIYTAAQAERNGLIDYMGSFDDTLLDMKTKLFDGHELEVNHYRHTYEKNFYDFFYSITALFEKKESSLDMRVVDSLLNKAALPENMEYPAYYYKHP